MKNGAVPAQELVILGDHPARLGIGEARVKTHGHAAIGREFGNADAGAGAFVFAERERFAAGRPADVARLQGAFAEPTIFQVGVKRGTAGAVPEVVFILGPKLLWQQTTFVAFDLVELSEVIPLAD